MIHRAHIALSAGGFELLTTGPEDGPVALCLHGFPDFPPSFEPLLGALGRAGYRAVAPWLRGYSPSTLEGPFDLGRIAGDILAIAGALSPDRPVFLVGHDWGAAVTQLIASKWPERIAGIVTMAVPVVSALFANLPKHPEQLRRSWYIGLFQLPIGIVDPLVRRNDFALIDRLWRDWSPSYRAPEPHMRALKGCLAASMPAPVLYYSSYLQPIGRAIGQIREALARPPRIRVPALSLMGEEDGCIAPELGEGEERSFDGPFRREVIPGVGHFMQVEQPEAIARRVIAWFEPLALPTSNARPTNGAGAAK
jgi:pimeloyl-ACP methyl ester carboxylesterase